MTCSHWWIIETPDGPTSRGECRHCHEVREFQNTTPTPTKGGGSGITDSKEIIEARRRDKRENLIVPYGLEG